MPRQDATAVTFDFSDPRRTAALAVGAAAAPFWAPLFATAAGAGVAWWWMTGWTRAETKTRAPKLAALIPATLVDEPVAAEELAAAVVEGAAPAVEIAALAPVETARIEVAQTEVVPAPAAEADPVVAAEPLPAKARKSSKSRAKATSIVRD